ncbi:hypothetical protein [Hymenobacter ruber]
MRLKINGRQYIWPCKLGSTNILRSYYEVEGGTQGQDGIVITYEEQPSYTLPKPYKAVRATVVLGGTTYAITGIGTSTSHVNYMLGSFALNESANNVEGTFSGEENQLGIRLDDGTFTTVVH